MERTDVESAAWRRLICEAIRGPDFCRATFAGAKRGSTSSPWRRVVIRPVELRGERYLQFSYFDARKDISKNYRDDEIDAHVDEILALGFAGIHITTCTEEIDIRTSKKGAVSVSRRPADHEAGPELAHNRAKDVPLPEGRADRLLEVMGVLDAEGRVRPTMRAKYTQINEFLKQLRHVLDDAGLRTLGRSVDILDCGCGLSYLTVAVHHYLNDVLGIPAQLLGVDVNEDVIRKSVERSQQLNGAEVNFACGRIGQLELKADIVLALHACDTATDDAIAQAVAAEARLLLCVPCCHHHLNDQLRAVGPAEVLRPLLRHGILQQRTADLVTDAFRALALRILGYRTDVVEFVGTEHTARNLMIRAVRGASIGDAALVHEYLELRRFWGVTPYLEQALGERFQDLLKTESTHSPGYVQ